MKMYVWILLAFGIIGFFSGYCILSKQEEVKNKEKKISLWKQIMPLILIILSSVCIGFACILPYDTSQSNWSTSLNMDTDTIEINEEKSYIEISRNDNGFIKKEKYYFTGEIKGKFNNQESKHYESIVISAKKITQTSFSLYFFDINEINWLEDIVIQESQ